MDIHNNLLDLLAAERVFDLDLDRRISPRAGTLRSWSIAGALGALASRFHDRTSLRTPAEGPRAAARHSVH